MKSINLKIQNNTSTTQNVSLLGVVPDPNSANNINNLYQFDLTGQSYVGIVSVSITYAPTSTLFYTTVTVPVTNQSIQGVVDALNTLNIGIFTLSGNIISVGSNTYIYQNITFGLPFISTWDTTITFGSSTANNQVQLPLNVLGTYNFFIDWGDGTQNIITYWNQPEILHTYATAGIYTITMTGLISEWSFGDALFSLGISDSRKLLSISSWGDLQFGTTTAFQCFYQCNNLDLSFVSDLPNLSNTLYLEGCFSDCNTLTAINRSNEWNTSNVVNMVAMFYNSDNFNSDITTWDTSNVTNMNLMFSNSYAFNQPIGSWNVSNVTNMNRMFNIAIAFNQNLNSWDVGSVTNMSFMFSSASVFNGNISSWNVSSVTDMSYMFYLASAFNQNLNSWDVGSVTNMSYMFSSASAFNQNLNSWDVSSVTTMLDMFGSAISFNGNISSWNVSNVANMQTMFSGALAFNQNLNSWDVSNVTNMRAMFDFASSFDGNISSWNVSNVTNMNGMFRNATAFNQDIGNWNVSNVGSFVGFMALKTNLNYSASNLDSIYNNWSLLSVQPNLRVDFGTIKYTAGASAGRLILTSAPNNWILFDGGI
jgi:surface protein